jgi:hypothetical protein
MMKENLGEFLELEDERRGKGRLRFQTWVRIFGMLQASSLGSRARQINTKIYVYIYITEKSYFKCLTLPTQNLYNIIIISSY